jgi:hypothetical protein
MNTDSGVYGVNYLKRAAVATFEIDMNRPKDAIYPDTAATLLDGTTTTSCIATGALPPVDEFWSMTVYDLLDRSNQKPNDDGSVNIYLQNKSPGADKDSNWLPVPVQPFSPHARLCSPRSAAIGRHLGHARSCQNQVITVPFCGVVLRRMDLDCCCDQME